MMKLEDILSKLTGVSKETPVIDVLKGIKNDISVISDTFKQPEQSALIKLLRGDKNTEQAPSKNLITKVLDTLKNVGKFSAVKDNVVANDSKGSVGTPLTVTTSSSVKSSTANVAENKPYTQLIPLKPATPTSDNNAVKAPGSTTTDSSKGEAQESVFSKKDVLEEIRDSILKVQENTKDIFEFLKNSKDKNKTKTVEKEKEKEKEETDEDGRGPGTQLFDSIADFLGDSGSGDSKKSGKKSGSKKSSTRYRDAKGRFTKKPQGIIGRAAQAVRNVGAKIGGSRVGQMVAGVGTRIASSSAGKAVASAASRVGSVASNLGSKAMSAIGTVGTRASGALSNVASVGSKATGLVSGAGKALGGLGRLAGKAAAPLAAAMAVYDGFKGWNADKNATTWQKIKNAGRNVASGLTFGVVDSTQDKMAKGEYTGTQKKIEDESPKKEEEKNEDNKPGLLKTAASAAFGITPISAAYNALKDSKKEETENKKENTTSNKESEKSEVSKTGLLKTAASAAFGITPIGAVYNALKDNKKEESKEPDQTNIVKSSDNKVQNAEKVTPVPSATNITTKATEGVVGNKQVPTESKNTEPAKKESSEKTQPTSSSILSARPEVIAWKKKGYATVDDIPTDEVNVYLDKYKTKSLPPAFAKASERKILRLFYSKVKIEADKDEKEKTPVTKTSTELAEESINAVNKKTEIKEPEESEKSTVPSEKPKSNFIALSSGGVLAGATIASKLLKETQPKSVVPETQGILTKAKDYVTTKGSDLISKAPEALTKAKDLVNTKGKELISKAPEVLTKIGSKAVESVKDAKDLIATKGSELLSKTPKLTELGSKAIDSVKGAKDLVITKGSELISKAPEVLSKAKDLVTTKGRELISKAPELGSKAIESVTKVKDLVTTKGSELISKTPKLSELSSKAIESVKGAKDLVATKGKELISKAPEALSKAKDLVTTKGKDLLTKAPEALSKAKDLVATKGKELISKAPEALTKAKDLVATKGKELISKAPKLTELGSKAIESVKGAKEAVISKGKDLLTKAPKLSELGSKAVKSLKGAKDFVTSGQMVSKGLSAVKGLGATATSAAAKTAGAVGTGAAKGLGRFIPGVGTVITAGTEVFGAYNKFKDVNKAVESGEMTKEQGQQEKGKAAGGAAGSTAGAALGATLGAVGGPLGMALGGMVGSWLGGKVGKGVGGLAVKGWQGLKSVAGKTKDMVAGGISAVGKGAAKLGSALVGGVGGLVKGGASLVGKGLSSVLGLDRDKYAKETAENTSKIYLLLKESKYFTSKSEDKGTENENTVEGSISDTVTGDNNAPASNTLKSLPVPKKGFDINSYNISNNQKIKDLGGKEINPENLKPNTAVASNTSTDSTTLNTNLKSTPSSEIATSTGTTAPVITGAKKPQSGSSKSTIIGAALGSALGPLGTIAGGYIGSKVGKMFAGKTESTIKPPNTPSSSSLSNISSLSGNTTQIAILRQISQNTAQTNNNIKQLANGLMNLSKSLLKTGSISQIPPEFNINAGGSEAPSGSPSLQSVFSQSDDIISRVRGEFAL